MVLVFCLLSLRKSFSSFFFFFFGSRATSLSSSLSCLDYFSVKQSEDLGEKSTRFLGRSALSGDKSLKLRLICSSKVKSSFTASIDTSSSFYKVARNGTIGLPSFVNICLFSADLFRLRGEKRSNSVLLKIGELDF